MQISNAKCSYSYIRYSSRGIRCPFRGSVEITMTYITMTAQFQSINSDRGVKVGLIVLLSLC